MYRGLKHDIVFVFPGWCVQCARPLPRQLHVRIASSHACSRVHVVTVSAYKRAQQQGCACGAHTVVSGLVSCRTNWTSPMEASIKCGARLHVCVLDSITAQLREVRALVNVHTLPRTLLWSILGTKDVPVQRTQSNRIPQELSLIHI